MAGRSVSDFDQGVQNLAYCDSTGLLRIWDIETAKVIHEYLPSSHLSASCTCVKWRPRRGQSTPQKRRRISQENGSDAPDVNDDDSIVAMGTATGSILIYNVTKGELQCKLEGGHTCSIADISWNDVGTSLISCSSDSEIAHWNLKTTKHTNKWRCGMRDVAALSVYQNYLILAGRAINIYDLSAASRKDGKITPIKKITGHSTNVSSLHCLDSPTSGEFYIVSLASADRSVSIWSVVTTDGSEGSDKPRSTTIQRPILTLILGNEPVMSSAFIRPGTRKLTLSVVTTHGDMETFDVKIPTNSRKIKKPVQSESGVEIATSGKELIPVLVVKHLDSNRFVVVYGSESIPVLETMDFSKMDSTEVVREDPSLRRTEKLSRHSNVVAPLVVLDRVTQLSGACETLGGKRRARFDEQRVEMMLSKRIEIADKAWKSRASNQSDSLETRPSLVPILCQGLQSSDSQLLDTCLRNPDQEIMSYTIKHLPPKYIVPFTKLMVNRLQTGYNNQIFDKDTATLVRWCQVFFHEHASLLAFHPLLKTLRHIYHNLERNCGQMVTYLKLQGRLGMVLSQIDRMSAEAPDTDISRKPLMRLADDSSDEELEDGEPSGVTAAVMKSAAGDESEDGYSSGDEEMEEDIHTATKTTTV